MKQMFTFMTLFLLSLLTVAQTPESFQYQAVVRDAGGVALVNQPVGVQISIIAGPLPGSVVYSETFATSSNGLGVINLAVGSSVTHTGDFSLIDWGNGSYFVKVEIDPAGGVAYADMGTVQLLSVPYALHAKTADNSFSGNYGDLTNTPDFSNWDNNVNDDFNGVYSELIGKPNLQPVATTGDYNDLTNKPVLAGDVIGATDATTVQKIQGKDISTNIPANGQVLKWNNVSQAWEPADDQLGAAGTTDGVVNGASFSGTTTKTLTLIRSNGLGDITAVFTDEVNDADADPTNELQHLTVVGNQLSISSSNSVTLPQTNYTAGNGINISGNQIINIAPDQTVSLTGAGATQIFGSYPDFTISSLDENTQYTGGTGILVNGTEIINTSPDQVLTFSVGSGIMVSGGYPNYTITNTNPDQEVTLTGQGNTTITGTYPNFIVSGTDNNTTYTAGAGLSLTGTAFSHTPHTGDATGSTSLTVTGIQGRSVSTTAPASGEVLKYNGTSWAPASDQNTTYTQGSGINISGTTISNTSPDQTVTISNGTGISVSGSYPDFTVTNTQPNQPVSITGAGATTVSGTYPNFTVTSTDNNTTYSPGTGISFSGTTINNASPDQTVTLSGTGSTTVSGTYPSFTINSTDNNTTYTAGTGLTLAGTTFSANSTTAMWNANLLQGVGVSTVAPLNGQIMKYDGTNWVPAADNNTTYTSGTGLALTGTTFSHSAHTGDATGSTALTVTGMQGRAISTNIPGNGQVLKWNSTSSKWEPNDDALGAAGTNDGVVTGASVTGTTTKTLTLTRSESLGSITATFNDEGSSYTAGTGISIASNVITNDDPDQTVTLTGGGSTTITGAYPNFSISSTNNTYTAGTGMTLSGSTFNAQTTSALWNANQLQGVNVSTTTPTNGYVLKYNGTSWAPAIDNNTTYTAGTGGITVTGTTINNTLPDQTVTISGSGATSVTGTYPNFSISSTDNNTVYTAGLGLTLAGTQFSHAAHTGDATGSTLLTVTALRGRTITTTAPALNQVYKFNGTSWAPAADDNTTYTAGSGLALMGTTFQNTAPDVAITLNGGGSTTITGTYPVFTISSTDNNSGGTVTSIGTGAGLTGGPITTTGTVALTGQALALHNLATTGLITRTGVGTVAARTITGSTSISVLDGNGVLGNPTLSANFGTTAGTIAEGSHAHSNYTAAGTNGMVQFNNSGVFGGVQGFMWDNTNSRMMINGATSTGQQSNLIVRQSVNPINTTRDSVILANLGFDIRQSVTGSNNYGSGMKFTIGDGSTYTGTAAIFANRTGSYGTGDLHFAVNNLGSSSRTTLPIRMTIKSTGNVGIGTTTPLAQLEVKGEGLSAVEPLFEVKNRAGQTVFIVYEDSVRVYVDDDPTKETKGTFAVSGRNSAKAFTNNYLVVDPLKTKVFTGDDAAGFQVNTLNGGTKSYMTLTPVNILIGDSAGYTLTSATDNVLIGNKAGKPLTTGGSNTIIGHQAGYSIPAGSSQNVIIGKNSGPSASVLANVYIGNNCGASAGAGLFNTMVGNGAGQSSTEGLHAFFGAMAGGGASGVGNTYIGALAGQNTNGENNTFVGKYAGSQLSSTISNAVVLGDESITSMYCIGAYVGTVGTTYRDVYVSNAGKIGYVSSSIRYKMNVANMENVDWMYQLRPVNYLYKNDPDKRIQYGLIAEEVEKLNPLFVSYNADGTVETVNYSMFISPMLKALSDQKIMIDDLKIENEKLKNNSVQIENILKEMEQMKAEMNQLKATKAAE